jgi:ABC-type phosphate transport system substrate-binding protein
MKKFKLSAAPLTAAIGLLFASTCYGQLTTPQVVGVGSSALFPSVTIAMVQGDPIINPGGTTGYCGKNLWTAGSGIASGIDARSAGIPAEGGNIAVVWDTTPPTQVCVYLSVDSVVGQRLFLGQTSSNQNATISLTSAALTTAGANKVSFLQDTATTGLPSSVFSVVNGAHFNVAFTDIRPEDGQIAYNRAACALLSGDPGKSCMGYGPIGSVGTAVESSYSQTSAQVVAYSISGTDPFSGAAIPAFTTIPIGADPVVVIVNTSNTAAGGLGGTSPTFSNINGHTLAAIYGGSLGQTADILSGGGDQVLHIVEREPVSGTYNTFEWQLVHARDGNTDNAQESGNNPTPAGCFTPPATATFVPPTVACGNPMNAAGPVGSFRTRAIGTGEMVNAINSTNNPNSIGYAFWSLGTFGGKTGLKYLALDGVDPIGATYTNGVIPNCTGFFNTTPAFSCTGTLPSLTNVALGNYRVWSTLRAVIFASYVAPSSGPSVPGLILAAQDQAITNIPDFVPYHVCASSSCSVASGPFTSTLPVFRSHYNASGITANNGTNASFGTGIEGGGDMAGSIFTTRSDVDFFNTTGNEFLTWIQ